MKEKQNKQKMKLWKKITLGVVGGFIGLIIILVVTVFAVWRNELTSISSIELIAKADDENRSAPVYKMDISGGYYFDKFIENGGASNDSELIDFIVKNITKGIIPISIGTSDIGCSSFTAVTPDNERLFGRNYDFSTTTAMIVHTKPKGRLESYSSVDLQFLGIKDGVSLNGILDEFLCLAAPYAPLDGINEAGVSCGIYMSYQGENRGTSTNQQTDKPDLTSTTMLRMILDYAHDVNEAIELVKNYDLHDSANTSFHYMVADSKGDSAIFEWVAGTQFTDNDGSVRELKIYRNDDDAILGEKEATNDFQYITNFIVTPGYYSEGGTQAGLDRYNKIESMINPDGTNTDGVMTKEQALDVLQTVGRRKWDSENGVSDSNTITVWSVLYDLTNKTMIWVSNESFGDSKNIFEFRIK